jgi:16S rRNA processing protein RimM
MAPPSPELLEIGRVGRPHGVRGEVYVDLLTDREERLAVGSRLVARERSLTVLAARPSNGRWLVRFDGLDDRSDAERLTGVVLLAEPIEDAEALWVHELIGSRVVELDGTDRGRCVSVVANPAHDLLELDSGALVPVTFVVSCADGVTTVDVPTGLFDLTEPAPDA